LKTEEKTIETEKKKTRIEEQSSEEVTTAEKNTAKKTTAEKITVEKGSLPFLYGTAAGRLLLKLLIKPSVSKLVGFFMNSRISAVFIPGFIRSAGIDMSEYQPETYHSFNDFFTRRIRPEARPVDLTPGHLISPCDAMLSVYRITEDTLLPIKRSVYTAGELFRNNALAADFENGYCLVFRLGPQNYHRYCFPAGGLAGPEHRIPGVLHTVRPIAFKKYPVFTENAREYAALDTDEFGRIIQMEIGALFVGKIDNYPLEGRVLKGQEKGKFLFGGSTILLCVKDGVLEIEEHREEIPVKIGQFIAARAGF